MANQPFMTPEQQRKLAAAIERTMSKFSADVARLVQVAARWNQGKSDDFNRPESGALGAGWAAAGAPVAFGFDGARSETVAATCTTRGWTFVMREGDEPIPYGDPRLCEHLGGPKQ